MRRNEEGYTLFYTLIIMAMILSLSAYLFTKADLYRSVIESKKYTANTYLAAETLVISEGERISGRFNKLGGDPIMNEQEIFNILSRWSQENFYLYYAAKAYLEVTQSLFHTPSKDGYLYKKYQARPKYIIQSDQQAPGLVLEVESRVYPYNVQDASNPLKKDLSNLEKIKKAITKIDKELNQVNLEEDLVLDTLVPQFNILKDELLTKPLYEIEGIARIKKDYEILSSQTLYLTLYIEEQEIMEAPKVEGAVYHMALPYELKTGYLKAKKKSN